LPAISKIFEKLLFEQILNFLHDNNLLSPQQFGFRTGSSTVKAVTSLVEKIIDCFERKEYYSTSFLDLSKAFDCVSHDILLRKLYTYNFHPSSTRLILSYLSDRSQCVRINEVLSDFSHIVYGVPQGSILGPILFLIYVNDLSSYVSCADITLFADDTTVSNAEISMENLLLKKFYSISLTEEWFLANRLNLNKDKTVHMMFTLKQFVGGVEYSEQTKYLGIYVDMQLTWNAHGEQMASKISRNIYLLRNLANNLPLQSLRLAYFALVHCHIEYGILIWGHSGTLYRIFRLQRRAVWIIANLGFRDDCRQHFAKLKILTLPAIFIYRCLEYIIKNPKLYPKLSSYHQYSTRSQDIDHISLRLTKSQDGIHYYCIKFFNALPDSHKNLPPNQFLKHIKTYLLNKIIYSFDEFLNNSSNDLK
jgi:ribonuclease P/MRP protein subunit RPP40